MWRDLHDRFRQLASPHPGWFVLVSALLLAALGTSAIATVEPAYASIQLKRWLPIALLALTVCVIPPPKLMGRLAYPLLILSCLLLLFVVLPFVPRSIVPVRNGATAWINLGFMHFQPSEMSKVAFVLALAWYLRFRENQRTLLGLTLPFAIMFVPVVLILKEPDLGTAMVFAPTLLAVLVAAGAKLRHLFALGAAGATVALLAVGLILYDPPHERELTGQGKLPGWAHILASHQEKRVAALVWPEKYKQREAFQQITATNLIGAGGMTGMGGRSGVIIRENKLPEDHNDMIFAVIVNRWGLLGAFVVLTLVATLVGSILLVAARSRDPVARLTCVGFAAMLFTQATINVGMAVGLLPIIGITLPLVSYGGSSLLFTFVMVGIVLNFASRPRRIMERPSFEFDHADAIFQ